MFDVEWREDQIGWMVEVRAMGAHVVLRLHIAQNHLSKEEAIDRLFSLALAVAIDGAAKGWLEPSKLTRAHPELTPPALAWWSAPGGFVLAESDSEELGPARAAFAGPKQWWTRLLNTTLAGLSNRTILPSLGVREGEGAYDFLLKGGEGDG